ncbi:MAG: hypothetical protein M0R03_11505 [Novosphingobium sp.]|nr:hypothetical protein [Novosphingobium sp.]
MQSWKGVDIKKIVDEPQWQKLRESLVGTWKKTPAKNVTRLRWYLQTRGFDEYSVVRVYNYLTGTGFRMGVISHPDITKLKEEVEHYITIYKETTSKKSEE